MYNRTVRKVTVIVLALGLIGACSDDEGSSGAAAADPAAAFAAVPDIEATTTDGLRQQFVGTDSTGEFSIAIAETAAGAFVAYLCNGDDVGIWLSAASFADQTTVSAGSDSVTYERAGDSISGSAEVGGTQLTFTVAKAAADEGLFRTSEGSVVTGWIFTDGGGTVRGTTSSGTGVTTTGLIGDFLARRKCSKIVVRYSLGKMETLQTGNDDAEDQARADFVAAGCDLHGFAL